MSVSRSGFLAIVTLVVVPAATLAGDLTLTLQGQGAGDVRLVGALRRWDADGQPLVPVDPKAAIDAPRVDAAAEPAGGGRWVFRNLPPGRYDLVILAGERTRVEGFHYPPVTEFDPFLPPDTPTPEPEARDWIVGDIARARHYENKVTPLYLASDDAQVRILMQLVRDLPTSYDSEYGAPVATVRHEVWQYTYRYGSWSKDRETRVLDRILLPRDEFCRWTWIWEPALGGIEVGASPAEVTYNLPARLGSQAARGWFPEAR